jgi:hypothetical protein
MATPIDLENVSYSKAFGVINKAKWFQVENYFGPFSVEFSIQRNQQTPTSIKLENLNGWQMGGFVVPAGPGQSDYTTVLNFFHNNITYPPQYVIVTKNS